MKECFISPDERDAILDYFGELIPEDEALSCGVIRLMNPMGGDNDGVQI